MKMNIFRIPEANVAALEGKLSSVGLRVIHQGELEGWEGKFYFSKDEGPSSIPWVETFSEFFMDEGRPANLIYFAVYFFRKGRECFVLSYGKSHFYVRQYCDHDFGIEMAKRLGNKRDVKQTSSKRFAGRKRKEIKSYTTNSPLSVESGESVDYLRITIDPGMQDKFGRSGKFGSSMLIGAPVTKDRLGLLLDEIVAVMGREEKFQLPRTSVIRDGDEVAKYDKKLLDAIFGNGGYAEFSCDTHDIVGVDFVFSGSERYSFSLRGRRVAELGERELDLATLQEYVLVERIPVSEIFDVRIQVENEGQRTYSKGLRDALEFVVDDENVMLSQGRWVRFNEDYIHQLNSSIDEITVESTETDLLEIDMKECCFNAAEYINSYGYASADRDFTKIGVSTGTPVEAWDLYRDGTVYAVKFGTPQKLGYACDQASNVLEILRNKANTKALDQKFVSYCLWFAFSVSRTPARVSDTGSIILKQKIDAWARRCRDLEVEPKIKISKGAALLE
ncbi:uncharacterized protein (TIGR04141 family) [Micromonospora sp. Llam0]|nr:uncharacterized protein (TIGR04141 family) [Micromonospora sp. Llam0]